MIRSVFLAAVAVLVSSVAAAAANPPASPIAQLQLKGHWACTQTGGGGGTYSEDWTTPLGGLWLRATDSVKGQTTQEHTVTFSKVSSTWVVLDAFPTGAYDVLHGTASPNLSSIAFHAVYPKLALAVTYKRLTPAKYSIDVMGNIQGKKVATHAVCVK
jgi:poly(3-hydroxybutyrate) depolymerase